MATKTAENEDKRLFSASSARNKAPVLQVLKEYAPQSGQALEIACGSGEHSAYFARFFPNLTWQPTDIETRHLESANAHRMADNLSNMKEAKYLDVTCADWNTLPLSRPLDLIYNANMIHIAPQACISGLMTGAGRHLKSGGLLVMYGPYMINHQHTAASNAEFDASLKSRNSTWGIRNLEDVISIAKQNRLAHQYSLEMPANNFCIIYKKV